MRILNVPNNNAGEVLQMPANIVNNMFTYVAAFPMLTPIPLSYGND